MDAPCDILYIVYTNMMEKVWYSNIQNFLFPAYM